MKLVPFSKAELEIIGYRKTKNYELLLEFAESDLECAKVEGWTGKSAHIKTANLNRSIDRFKMYHIKAVCRGDEIYLVKGFDE